MQTDRGNKIPFNKRKTKKIKLSAIICKIVKFKNGKMDFKLFMI